VDRSAVTKLIAWRDDPVRFVKEIFQVEPDLWQAEVLRQYQRTKRLALSACKGPGKSCVMSWIAWHFLLTRQRPKIACTSITEDNLRDGLWSEMSKWQSRSKLLQESFEVQKKRIVRKDDPELAWMSFRTWSKAADENTLASTLAGLHEDEIMALIDESGGIPPAILREAEGALTTGIDAHIIQAGNPISRNGALFVACVRQRHMWHVVEITSDPDDPKRTTRVDPEWVKEQIREHGRDDPWVQANILGRFPTQSLETLVTEEEVREAMFRSVREDQIQHAPRILGVDTARFGIDKSVIFPRQGLIAFKPESFQGLDTQRGLAILARKVQDWHPDATFIDDTGGHGAGWVDGMRTLGHSVIGIHFSNRPDDARYFNKRAEMYFLMSQWIKGGGQLPNIPELIAELCEPQYSVHPLTGKFIIEDKDQIKSRIGRSPDYADALALTWAMPVAKHGNDRRRQVFKTEYNPYADMFKTQSGRTR
jgi:phage terminase large subunit